jgi:hypothetical protein
MAGKGTRNMDSFVDGLFDDDGLNPGSQVPPTHATTVVPRMAGTVIPNTVIRGPVGPNPLSVAGVPSSGLGSFTPGSLGPSRPSSMPNYPPSTLTHTQQHSDIKMHVPSSRPVSGPLIPGGVLSSTVPSAGFASSNVPLGNGVGGGLASMQTKLVPNSAMPSNSGVVLPNQAGIRVSLPPSNTAMTQPPKVAVQPQAVSTKTATASMAKVVSSTASSPAAKKQMVSESGQSRARNADGTIKDEGGGDEEDEELITREVEETAFEPIMYGKSRLTDEEMRRERAKDEDRRIVNARVVKVKVAAICDKEKVKYSDKVAEAIALGLQRRIEGALEMMVEFSRRRMDVEGDTASSCISRSSNARLYLKEEERKRQEEREKRIAEKLAAESGTAALDPSVLRRQEEETAATVLDFAGGARARRPNTLQTTQFMSHVNKDGSSSSMDISTGHAGNTSATSASSMTSIKDRNRRVTLNDALNFLIQDLHAKNSLITLNTMAGLKIPEAYAVTTSQYSGASAPTTTAGGMTTRSSASSQSGAAYASSSSSSSTATATNPSIIPTTTGTATLLTHTQPQRYAAVIAGQPSARPTTAQSSSPSPSSGLSGVTTTTGTPIQRPIPSNMPPNSVSPRLVTSRPSPAPTMSKK